MDFQHTGRSFHLGNACRASLLATLGVVLVGCSTPRFSGESVSDPLLRRDVLGTIEMLQQCRRLQQVEPEILGYRLNEAGGLALAQERWQVTGCGRQVGYLVDFRSAAQGGVNFSVRAE